MFEVRVGVASIGGYRHGQRVRIGRGVPDDVDAIAEALRPDFPLSSVCRAPNHAERWREPHDLIADAYDHTAHRYRERSSGQDSAREREHTSGRSKPWACPHHHRCGKPVPQFFSAYASASSNCQMSLPICAVPSVFPPSRCGCQY